MKRYIPTKIFGWGSILIFLLAIFSMTLNTFYYWVLSLVLISVGVNCVLISMGKIQWVEIYDEYLLIKHFKKRTKIRWNEIDAVYKDQLVLFKVYHLFTKSAGKIQLMGYHDLGMIREIVKRSENAYIDMELRRL